MVVRLILGRPASRGRWLSERAVINRVCDEELYARPHAIETTQEHARNERLVDAASALSSCLAHLVHIGHAIALDTVAREPHNRRRPVEPQR